MPVEHGNGSLIAFVTMGATWIVAAVGSHASLRQKVKSANERETERHEETRKLIDAQNQRHIEAMGLVKDDINYIRRRIDTVIDNRE